MRPDSQENLPINKGDLVPLFYGISLIRTVVITVITVSLLVAAGIFTLDYTSGIRPDVSVLQLFIWADLYLLNIVALIPFGGVFIGSTATLVELRGISKVGIEQNEIDLLLQIRNQLLFRITVSLPLFASSIFIWWILSVAYVPWRQ
jgi:hypothetical protein